MRFSLLSQQRNSKFTPLAMKTHTTSTPQNPDHNRMNRLLDDLQRAVSELPLESMIESVKLPNGPSSSCDSNNFCKAHDIIRLLAVEASLGDYHAVRSLRYLGILITETLMSLAKIETQSSQSDPNHSYTEHLDFLFGHQIPILKLRGDISKIRSIITKDSDLLATLPLDLLQNGVENYQAWNTSNHLVINLVGLNSPNIKNPDGMTAVIYENRMDRVKRWEQLKGVQKESAPSAFETITPREIIHDFIRRLIATKIFEIIQCSASRTVGRVASDSVTWPVLHSAFNYGQPEIDKLLDSMQFGSNLPFRLRKKGTAGSPRKFEPGAQTSFALMYCLQIHQTREAYKHSTAEELDDIRRRVGEIEKGRDPILAKLPSLNLKWISYRDGLWSLKAALLPPFPTEPPSANQASKDAFDAWHQVAMGLAEQTCYSNWEGYPWWPSCVVSRSGLDNKKERVRSTKESVSEKLRKGMMKLQSVG